MVERATLRECIEILGVFSMFGLSVLIYLLWWIAFFEGGRIWIDITRFGERWVEYAIWMVVTPLITLGMYFYVTDRDGRRR